MSEISGGSDSMDMSSETETGGTETGVSVETGGHMDLGAETSSQSVEGWYLAMRCPSILLKQRMA